MRSYITRQARHIKLALEVQGTDWTTVAKNDADLVDKYNKGELPIFLNDELNSKNEENEFGSDEQDIIGGYDDF